jgi:hypothetical protein
MVGNDQPFVGYERTGTAVNSAYTVDDADGLGVEDFVGGEFDASFFQPDISQFANREHSLITARGVSKQAGSGKA